MRKLFTLLCLIVLLSACHGSKGMASLELPENFDTSKNYEITFWAKNDTNKTQVNIYEKAIDDFEALYPNIHVNMRLYTDYGKIYNDVITNIQTRTTPNVCISYPDHIATYLSGANLVADLDALMLQENYGLAGKELRFDGPSQAEIIPSFLEEGKINGITYALPYMRSTEACYINEDYVKKLGYEIPEVLTWDYIFEVSEAAMAKDEEGNFLVNGQKVMIPFIYKSTDNMMISYLKQADAPYSQADGTIEIFNDTTRAFLEEIAKHAETGAFSTFKISSYPANYLNAGQCIFAIDSTAGSTWMGSEAPLIDIAEEKLVKFHTVVKMIPQIDPSHPQMISQGPSLCIFNKDESQEVVASWLFTQFLLTNEVQESYASTEGYVPVTSKALEDPAYIAYLEASGSDNNLHYDIKIDATKLLLDHIEDTFTTPVFNGSASLRDGAGTLIENTCKAKRRHQSVDDEFFEKLYKDITSLYRLDSKGASVGGQQDLGPLPLTSKLLLSSLVVVWVGIGAYALHEKLKEKD